MNLVVWRSSTWKTIGEVAIAPHAREVHMRDAPQALDRILTSVSAARPSPIASRMVRSNREVRISSLLLK